MTHSFITRSIFSSFVVPAPGMGVGWDKYTTTNPDGSTNYDLESKSGSANLRSQPFNFGFGYAHQNGNPVPTGIGSISLTGEIPISIVYAGGLESNGYIPTPCPIANGPQQQVPETNSGLLLLLGLGGLGAVEAHMRRKDDIAKYKMR